MSHISIFKKISLSAALLLMAATATAQTYQLPKAHRSEHSSLIAKQENVSNQVSVNETKQFLENLFKDEDEPEIDIYTQGWNSRSVNAYVGKEVPNTQVIDVSEFAMPVPGFITSPYGYRPRFGREHKGVDLKLHIGDTVRAAFDGRVRLTNFERKGYGYYVIVRHPNGLETVYGHLSKFLVKPDQYVKAGEPIALGGNTGRSTGPHLHFETRFMGYPINPQAIFDFANQTVHTDTYTFDKRTYKQARNFDPEATRRHQQTYTQQYLPPKGNANATAKARKTAASSYTVKKGDTLSKIASRNGMTVRQLCKLNHIKSSAKLPAGTKLRLK